MGGENLSPSERASLLGSGGSGGNGLGDIETFAGQAAGLRRAGAGRAAAPLDFHYAERIGPAVMAALESLHATAARDFAAALSVLVRTNAKLKITRVTQVTCAEFVRALERPTCVSLVAADRLACTVALDVSPAIMFPIMDRMLGGGHDPSPPLARPLTEIEKRLAARVTALWIDALARAWQTVAPVKFELLRVETNPQLANVATASERVVVVQGELMLADAAGTVKFCLPTKSLENVRDLLLGVSPHAAETHSPASSTTPRYTPGLVELVAELASVRITASELATIRVGDIITTDTLVHSPLTVRADGVARFHARPGAFKGRRALCIQERLEPREAA
ncbi:MAG TPA: FliM/FliN family flagellar motor switch protein [Pirellulales bacterium]|nr:FliM/FliN family flagellar motor switch protein [Pirellulales bacterium]